MPSDITNPPNILFIQMGFLGDVVLTLPTLMELARRYPSSNIYVLTTPEAKPLVEMLPSVKKVLSLSSSMRVIDILRNGYEISKLHIHRSYSVMRRNMLATLLPFVLRIPSRIGFSDGVGSFLNTHCLERPRSLHSVLRHLSILEHDPAGLVSLDINDLDLCIPKHVAKFSSFIDQTYIVVAPGSSKKSKRWDSKEAVQLVDILHAKGFTVVITGSEDECVLNNEIFQNSKAINMTGKTTIPELFFLVSHASAVVCVDSFLLHICSLLKQAVVSIFCSTTPDFGYGPYENDDAVVLEAEGLRCRPCALYGPDVCKIGTYECTKAVRAYDVANAVYELLTKKMLLRT